MTKRVGFGVGLWVVMAGVMGSSGCKSCGGPGGGDDGPEPTVIPGVAVSNTDVRSCDLVFEVTEGGRITAITFDPGVRGVSNERPPLASASFVNREDAAIAGRPVKLDVEGADAEVSILRATCFDRAGVEIADPGVSLN